MRRTPVSLGQHEVAAGGSGRGEHSLLDVWANGQDRAGGVGRGFDSLHKFGQVHTASHKIDNQQRTCLLGKAIIERCADLIGTKARGLLVQAE